MRVLLALYLTSCSYFNFVATVLPIAGFTMEATLEADDGPKVMTLEGIQCIENLQVG